MSHLKLVIFDLDDTLFDSSGQLKSAEDDVGHIKIFPEAMELIGEIRARGIRVALVSTGDRLRQEKKVEVLGLSSVMDAVLICDKPEDKKTLFQQCFQKFAVQPTETLVVGDRIDREIQMGNSLGCITVRVLHGRHSKLIAAREIETADFTIANVGALRLWFGPWLPNAKS